MFPVPAFHTDTLSVPVISTLPVSSAAPRRPWATAAWRRAGAVLCASLAMLLAACSSTKVGPGSYRVQSGDTLSKIAREHNTSVAELMRLNNLSNPNRISKGQVLRVNAKGSAASASSASSPPPSAAASAAAVRGIKLVWPADGTVTHRYNGSSSKGITIVNKTGTPVRAAAAGSVVYAGNRLRGYGNLVIVQHADHFLSIYAHNNRMLVKEGQKVSQGQQIAEMGSTDRSGPGLYFELRYRGKPVDPSGALPPR
ncbi:LysM peptidoglycan-binding domain-containing M23 family metallopeptidase [Bordetella petrii]|uniref:peptidoglycan DD-metalloendopeptidase family protein n=1 Tax=Bordetella petrii TaxID=94624 RepID=UPI001A963128|nr:peptidoglycan DD-metalloendopeptidase family protein [Bordetella petrii]